MEIDSMTDATTGPSELQRNVPRAEVPAAGSDATEKVVPPVPPSNETELSESSEEKGDPMVEMFIRVALRGALELREHLRLDETNFVRVSGQAHADGRAYVMYAMLDEAQKAGLHLILLKELFERDEIDPHADLESRLIVTHVLEDARARTRRLVEAFVRLVLFESTNEQAYYRHFLATEELRDAIYQNEDLEEFHGARYANLDESIRWSAERCVELQAGVDFSRVWYLKRATPIPTPLPSPRELLRYLTVPSMRDMIKLALPRMTPNEKLAVGLTYDDAYSRPSEGVHFSPMSKAHELREGEDHGGVTRVGLLTVALLDRVSRLLGQPEAPLLKKMTDALARSEAPRFMRDVTDRSLNVGDFMLAYGNLAEVVEVKTSPYGYRVYRGRYLADRPLPGIDEDWFLARGVVRLYSRDAFLRALDANDNPIVEEIRPKLRELPPNELQPLLRETFVRLWPLIGPHILADLKARADKQRVEAKEQRRQRMSKKTSTSDSA
jgi:hypothetical protein